MAVYLITGCNKGIGLELTHQLSAKDPAEVGTIFATARGSASEELNEVISKSNKRVHFISLEVTSDDSIAKAVKEVEKSAGHLDVLINNAGISIPFTDGIESMQTKDMLSIFDTNTLSVHRMMAAFLPLLEKGKLKKVANVSSSVGSITMVETFAPLPVAAYSISKAALNSLTAQWAARMKGKGFTFLSISPGWLRTRMGSEYADLPVSEGAASFLDAVHSHGPEDSGKFFNIKIADWENRKGHHEWYDGKELPW